MKRFILLAMAAVLALGLMGMPAAAQTKTGGWDWPPTANGEESINAVLYSSLSENAGPSNRIKREMDFTTEVQVAQWSYWHFSGTKWTWFVRKPGEYYADSITATIKSNGNVAITFEGFSNPTYVDGQPLEGVNKEIPVEYGVGSHPTSGDFIGWFTAEDLNEQEALIFDSETLHNGATFKLWNKISVCDCNSAGVYRSTGKITMTLQNQAIWLDENGDWNPGRDDLASYVTPLR